MSEQPSDYWIDALEDSELICMSMHDREEILQHIPNFQVFTRQQLTGAYAAMQQRITMLISASPDKKYEYFLARFSDIARRAPQYMVASYLGMTPETLSRVRKRRS